MPVNKIYCADVLDALRELPDNLVHLIITSPPFNVQVSYDTYKDNLPHLQYLSWMKDVWAECKRVLVPGGRICINIDATMNLEEGDEALLERVHPLHVDFTNQLRDLGYIYRAEIVWCKQNAPGKKTAWGSYCSCSNPHIRRNTEYVIIASKNSLRLDGDPNKCDITKEEFHRWTLSEWEINPETNNKGHPVPFPSELVRRCIKLFSYVDNIVMDPFCGSGTTLSTAVELGRRYIGIDISKKYCEIANNAVLNASKEIEIAEGYHYTASVSILKEQQEIRKQQEEKRDMFCDSESK